MNLKKVSEDLIDKYVDKSANLSISQLKELFIGTQILGNDFNEVLDYIKNPMSKKDYLVNDENEETIGY